MIAKNENKKNPIINKYSLLALLIGAIATIPIKDNNKIEKLDSKMCVQLYLKFSNPWDRETMEAYSEAYWNVENQKSEKFPYNQ